MRLNNRSITSQMVLSLVSTAIFIVIFATLFHVWYSIDHEKRAFMNESRLEADLIEARQRDIPTARQLQPR